MCYRRFASLSVCISVKFSIRSKERVGWLVCHRCSSGRRAAIFAAYGVIRPILRGGRRARRGAFDASWLKSESTPPNTSWSPAASRSWRRKSKRFRGISSVTVAISRSKRPARYSKRFAAIWSLSVPSWRIPHHGEGRGASLRCVTRHSDSTCQLSKNTWIIMTTSWNLSWQRKEILTRSAKFSSSSNPSIDRAS